MGTAAAPLAAKAALDESIAKQAGVSVFGSPGFASAGQPAEAAQLASGIGPYIPRDERIHRSAGYIKMFGLPDFMEKDLRRNCKWVGGLDPDIACKRSWSMSVKLQEQRQRNYERMIETYQDESWRIKRKSIIKNFLGFDWPWG